MDHRYDPEADVFTVDVQGKPTRITGEMLTQLAVQVFQEQGAREERRRAAGIIKAMLPAIMTTTHPITDAAILAARAYVAEAEEGE